MNAPDLTGPVRVETGKHINGLKLLRDLPVRLIPKIVGLACIDCPASEWRIYSTPEKVIINNGMLTRGASKNWTSVVDPALLGHCTFFHQLVWASDLDPVINCTVREKLLREQREEFNFET